MITDKGQVYSPKVKVLTGVARYLLPLPSENGVRARDFLSHFFAHFKPKTYSFSLQLTPNGLAKGALLTSN